LHEFGGQTRSVTAQGVTQLSVEEGERHRGVLLPGKNKKRGHVFLSRAIRTFLRPLGDEYDGAKIVSDGLGD
jgi:hypothetical protein